MIVASQSPGAQAASRFETRGMHPPRDAGLGGPATMGARVI